MNEAGSNRNWGQRGDAALLAEGLTGLKRSLVFSQHEMRSSRRSSDRGMIGSQLLFRKLILVSLLGVAS